MANIMLTDACNLHCPYCFANEFVNKDRNEISDEAFCRAMEFILGDGTHHTVGLIGGEPTTHPRFDALMRLLIAEKLVERIMVYTNGVLADRFADVLCHPKTGTLVNCNPPAAMGEAAFERLRRNLDVLFRERLCGDRVTLGINMYGTSFPYDYLIGLLERYGLKRVRVSITVPNLDAERDIDPRPSFLSMKPRVLQFFRDLLERGIVPFFDCNKIPTCLVSEGDLAPFRPYLDDPQLGPLLRRSNIATASVRCSPVIDIRQDLTAVRCFGLSGWTKQRIGDYKGIAELERFYLRTVDAYSCNTAWSSACARCHKRRVMECYGGCLAYRGGAIRALARTAESRMETLA